MAAQDARFLVLDEPSTALDVAHQAELVALLRASVAAGRGVLMASHDLGLAAALGGRVVALREGRIFADAAAEQVLQPDRLSELYGAEVEVFASARGARLLAPRL